MSIKSIRLITFLLFSLWANGGYAVVLYDNTTQAVNGSSFSPITGTGPLYDSFSTGVDFVVITAITLNLNNLLGSTNSFSINIHSNNANNTPGALLTSLTTVLDNSITSSNNLYSYTIGSSYTLSPNTRYWLGLTSGNGSLVIWNSSTNSLGTNVAGEFNANSSSTSSNASTNPYIMLLAALIVPPPPVNTSSIPEPAPLALIITGLIAAWRPLRCRQSNK